MTDKRRDQQRSNVSRRKFLGAAGGAAALSVAGCLGGGGDGLSGEVVLTGSSTVYPISQAMSEEFRKNHSNVEMSVDPTGTGGGFKNNFCPGNSDINAASRPIKDGELQNCRNNGVEPLEFQIAKDALTVAVNNENDWVDCITEDELRQIWKPNAAQRWSDVRPEWPDEEIERFGPATTSGTFDWFTEHIIGEARAHTDDYQPNENDNQLVQGIQGNEYAIGYFGYSYYAENEDTIKGLSIDAGNGCVEPTLDNAKSGDYPLARPLYIYVSESSLEDEAVRKFVEFYLEKSASDLVRDIGYVPVSEEQKGQNLDKFESATGDGSGSNGGDNESSADGNESSSGNESSTEDGN